VPMEKISQETVDIRCAHGNIASYPLAEVHMRVGNYTFSCRQQYQTGCLFPCSWDGMLTSCLVSTSVVIKTTKVVVDTTRSQRRQEELSEVERVACDRESGAMLSPLEEEVVPFSELDDDLFTESQGRPKLTKSPKRENKRKRFSRMQEEPARATEEG